MKQRRYIDLNELLYERNREGNPLSKVELAKLLNIWPSKLTTLLNPKTYRVSMDDELAAKVADVLNQPISYVNQFYSRNVA